MSASRGLATVVLALSGAALGSCAPLVTQLVVVLRTDLPMSALRRVEATVVREGSIDPIVSHTVALPGPLWPLSFGVIAARPEDARPLMVIVTLRYQDSLGVATINQIARVSLRPSKILQLDMTLERRCALHAGDPVRCVFPLTCRATMCVSMDRDNLPELNP